MTKPKALAVAIAVPVGLVALVVSSVVWEFATLLLGVLVLVLLIGVLMMMGLDIYNDLVDR